MEASSEGSRFTIVEAMVVVTMLAIVAAFAVPRLPASDIEARSVATTMLGDRLRTNAALAHARWLAQGRPPSIELDGRAIAMSFGYPDAVSAARIVANLDGFVYDDSAGVFSRTDDGRTPITGCAVVYEAPLEAGTAPEITTEIAGC